MQKILIVMVVCLISFGAFAECDESGKDKEKQEGKQKVEISTESYEFGGR